MLPHLIFVQPLSDCIILGLASAWAVLYLFSWDPLAFFFIHLLVWYLMDWILLLVIQVITVGLLRTTTYTYVGPRLCIFPQGGVYYPQVGYIVSLENTKMKILISWPTLANSTMLKDIFGNETTRIMFGVHDT